MAVDDPVLITCAISGAVANRAQCPAIPYTAEEYAAEARRAVDEGASMIHIHARTPDGLPSYEVEDFRAITAALTAEADVVVNFSTGAVGVPVEVERPRRSALGAQQEREGDRLPRDAGDQRIDPVSREVGVGRVEVVAEDRSLHRRECGRVNSGTSYF